VTPSTDEITFYWRPGCMFCMLLGRKLDKLDVPVNRVNIWEDAAAAATVREITGGDETVPTVVVGDVALVNPRVGEVVDALEQGRVG
jgi:glutaredoxin